MESVFSIIVDDKIPGKETQPVLPPEYPVTKPDVNPEKEKGEPFAYHVYGTAITHVTIDCVRGSYKVDKVEIVHDFGTSMNRAERA